MYSMIYKSTLSNPYACAREIGDQVHYHLLKHMAWWLQGLQRTLWHLSHYLCCYLAHLACLTISPKILLHTIPVVPLAKIAHQYNIDQSVLKIAYHGTKLTVPNANSNPQGLQLWIIYPYTMDTKLSNMVNTPSAA